MRGAVLAHARPHGGGGGRGACRNHGCLARPCPWAPGWRSRATPWRPGLAQMVNKPRELADYSPCLARLSVGTLYYGDNLEIMKKHVKSESVDLVYLDPPFNSNVNYNVFFRDASGGGGGGVARADQGV